MYKNNFILRDFIDTGQVGNIMQTKSPRHLPQVVFNAHAAMTRLPSTA